MDIVILLVIIIISLDMAVNRSSKYLPTVLFVALSGFVCLSASIHLLAKIT